MRTRQRATSAQHQVIEDALGMFEGVIEDIIEEVRSRNTEHTWHRAAVVAELAQTIHDMNPASANNAQSRVVASTLLTAYMHNHPEQGD